MYYIENEFIRVGIKQKGAELASIVDVKSGQEYMWEADPQYWGRHSSILFPIVGKVKDDRILIDGTYYPMKQHGFARNMDFEVDQKSNDQITFELKSNAESLSIFPYRFMLRVQYHLEQSALHIIYQVHNKDQQPIHFSIGAHPAFRCPLRKDEKRSDYQLIFSKKETAYRQLIKDGLRTGETQLVLNGENTIPITKDLFEQDALIFEKLQSDVVTLAHKNGKEILKFAFEGFPYLGIWSENSESPFVCLEPWHGIADIEHRTGAFKNKEGVMPLAVGDSFECTHRVEIL